MDRVDLIKIIQPVKAASETSGSYFTKILEEMKIEVKRKQTCHFYVFQTSQTREIHVFFQAVLLCTSEKY
jgi:hypothetical protein